MELSQATRQLRVVTELGPEALLLDGFSGTESISAPYTFRVDMVSTDLEIDTAALLRTPISLMLTLEDGSERRIHGHIAKVTQLGQKDGIASYRADMVPWFWFLGLNRESRVFQQMTVLEIVEKVLGDRGHSDYEIHCTGSYPTVEYCVQYRESDLAFIQRLLEREGIFYFFRHDDEKAVLVIADDNSVFEVGPHQPELRFRAPGNVEEEVIHSFQQEHSVHVGTVTLRDYDPLQPTLDLSATLSGDEDQEYYDYPGAYAKLFCNDPGDVAGEGERYARLRLELEECRRHRAAGQGNCRGILVGYTFNLLDFYRDDANTEYVVTSLSHVARGGGYRSSGGGDVDYQCSFSVITPDQPYRPELRTLRPVVEGTQTAVVVGPAGEEVWTDAHGRVKCQFPWDREGQRDENSSCWIRVASPWAGKGYGQVSIPRIGNEVVVDFVEGDPDRPLIVGSVYNADQTPPYALPDSDIQMGMKSRSSKGGGGYNEISMTDTKGSEKITIHAQHDLSTTILNDETHTVVNGNRKVTVQSGTNTETVKGDDTRTVQAGNHKLNVTGNVQVDATGTITETGKSGVTITGEAAGTTINGTGGPGVLVKGDPKVTIDGSSNAIITSPDVDIGSGTIKIHGSSIELTAGGCTISIGSSGITIEGGTITVKGNTKIN